MKTLTTERRRQLERTVVEARDIAEVVLAVALEALAVQHHEPYGHMGGEQRTLRRRLRAHARQLVTARMRARVVTASITLCTSAPTSTGTACCSPAFSPRTIC